MKEMWILGAALALMSCVLKVSFFRPTFRMVWASVVALSAAVSTLWLADWSPLALQEVLLAPAGRTNLTVGTTIESLLMIAFCGCRLKEMGRNEHRWSSRWLLAYPGVLVVASGCYLSSVWLLTLPGWSFEGMACCVAVAMLLLVGGGCWFAMRIWSGEERRLQLLFYTALLLLAWGVLLSSE